MDWGDDFFGHDRGRTEGSRRGLCALHDRALADSALRSAILGRVLTARNFDPTLQRYIASILSGGAQNVVLVVAILGFFGIETTSSSAALLAGVGLAVGAAWSGLARQFCSRCVLGHLPALQGGGDYVGGRRGGRHRGTEVGLFTHRHHQPRQRPDHRRHAKMSGDVVKELFGPCLSPGPTAPRSSPSGVDPLDAIARTAARAGRPYPMSVAEPVPDVEILASTNAALWLAVRPLLPHRSTTGRSISTPTS